MALNARETGGRSDDAGLLDRLSGWLPPDDSSADPTDRVLRAPWRHLAHQGLGTEQVRLTELRRLQNAGSAEDRVRSDYRGRYAIELLQNAHDACADADVVGQAWLQLTPTALLVANEGVPFTAERVDSLLQLGDSSKAANRSKHHTIGYKGIGFSAVMEITDEPQIVSAATRFCFHRRAARERIRQVLGAVPRAVPVRYFPFPLHLDDLGEDAGAVEALVDAGAVTVIRLPLVNQRKAKEVQAELEQGLRPETLLFMPHLQRLTLVTNDQTLRWSRRAGHRVAIGQVQHLREEGGTTRSWLMASKSVSLDKAAVAALEDPLWASVRKATVSVGVPWRHGEPDPSRGEQPMHVYFPTDDRMGRSLLVHGDFYVQSSRRRITGTGRGADVSHALAGAAADLTADLAVALAHHGNALLRTLAPNGTPDGFGTVVSELIDARLKTSPFLRPATDGAPLAVGETRRVVADLSERHLAALVGLLAPRSDVLRVGDDAGCAEWLDSLGTTPLQAGEIARRLTPGTSTSYDAMLSVVGRWFEKLQMYEANHARTTLQQRPLLQDQEGSWSSAQRLIRLDPRTPPLPMELKRAVYAPPKSKAARDFAATHLPVEVLTPQLALATVLAYVNRHAPDREAPGVVPFLRALWRREPSLMRDAAGTGLERVPVPARAIGSRDDPGYAPAGTVYFGKRWTNSETLDRMYGRFQRQEFLAADPPEERVRRQSDRQFWAALGVRDSPRLVPVDAVNSNAVQAWKAIEPVREAAVCPDGHSGSARAYQGLVLDRLAELLEPHDERSLRALAQHLCADPKPLGEAVTVVCQHGSHHGRGRGRKTVGFQRWLLTTRPWLPTDGGPGGRSLRLPQDTWTDVPAGAPRSVLPSPALRVTHPAALDLNSTHRPTLERLEAAMRALHEAFPQLDQSPAVVQDGAQWLLRKVDAAAAKQGPGLVGRRPLPLPARQTRGNVWSQSPVIADLPGAEHISGVAWLPAAPWIGLQRCYQLERASAVVSADVTATEVPSARPLLTRQDQVHLLALLIDRGGEPGSLAFRLGHLNERRVSSLEVTYRIHGRTWSVDPPFHLEPRLSANRRLQGGELLSLVSLESSGLVRLGHLLAQYLGVGESGDLIGQYLMVRDVLLTAHNVLPTQLGEAGQALKRYRNLEDFGTPPAQRSGSSEDSSPDDNHPHDGDATDASSSSAHTSAGSNLGGTEANVDPIVREDAEGSDRNGHARGSSPSGRSPGTTEAPDSGNGGGSRAPRHENVRFGAAEHRAAGDRSTPRPGPDSGGPRTGERPGAGTTGAATSSDAVDRRATEKAAEDIAISFLRTHYSATVERVGDQNVGWDLTATLPDGNRLLVEVKGFAGRAPDFVITRGERRAANRHPEYRVCVVTGVGSAGGELAWIEDTTELLADGHLDPYQWIVLDWPRCHHETLPWSDE
jgi:hypothetical protein